MTDELFVEADILSPVDRSTLETAAECPRQARFIEAGDVLNTRFCMASGSAVHDAISETITEYVESRGGLNPSEVADYLKQRLAAARPDVQPDAIRAADRIAWPLGRYLNELHYENIRCWDGGRGEHSSQLAYDLEEFGLRVTSELDLLHDSESPEIITEVDFKSGFEKWDHVKLIDSFQFQLHAVLVLKRFPDIKALQVKIWNTRIGNMTYPVLFKRESLYNYEYRIRNAAAAYFKTRGKEPNQCEAWPMVEKCEACPAAYLCDESKIPDESPEDVVDLMALMEAKVLSLRKIAIKAVKERGQDVTTMLGNYFGLNKPKANRQPTYSVYQIKSKKSDEPETESPE